MPLGLIFIVMNDLRKFVNEVLSSFGSELTTASPAASYGFWNDLRHDPTAKENTRYRRDVKRLWNKHADHSFFGDSKQFTVIHELGKYSGGRQLRDYFDENAVGNNPGIDSPARNELSCVGYVGDTHKTRHHVPYFMFKQKRVTFVSFSDAGSEWLSNARQSDKNFYKNSGLPKRPSSFVGLDEMPLSKLDFIEKPGYHMSSGEVIIAHWVVDTYYGHPDEQELAERLGLKFERF